MSDRGLRVNEDIRVREIRVIDENGEQLGVMAPRDALRIARERGLDRRSCADCSSSCLSCDGLRQVHV